MKLDLAQARAYALDALTDEAQEGWRTFDLNAYLAQRLRACGTFTMVDAPQGYINGCMYTCKLLAMRVKPPEDAWERYLAREEITAAVIDELTLRRFGKFNGQYQPISEGVHSFGQIIATGVTHLFNVTMADSPWMRNLHARGFRVDTGPRLEVRKKL